MRPRVIAGLPGSDTPGHYCGNSRAACMAGSYGNVLLLASSPQRGNGYSHTAQLSPAGARALAKALIAAAEEAERHGN